MTSTWALIVTLALLVSEGADVHTLRQAVTVWPEDQRVTALAYAYCESRGDPTQRNGVHAGAWQMNEELHGVVPEGLIAQAGQAEDLWSREGWQPWSDGCWLVSLVR